MAYGNKVFVTLYISVGGALLFSAACLGLSIYLWIADIRYPVWSSSGKGLPHGDAITAEIPAMAVTVAFSAAIFVSSCVGIYGVKNKLRGPLFAFIAPSFFLSIGQAVGLAVLSFQLARSDEIFTVFGIITLTCLSLSVAILVCSLVTVGMVKVDPNGQSVYNEDLSWCVPSAVSNFMKVSAVAITLLSAAVLAITLAYTLHFLPLGDEPIGTAVYIVPTMTGISIATIILAVVGFCGGVHHSRYPLQTFAFGTMFVQFSNAILAIALLGITASELVDYENDYYANSTNTGSKGDDNYSRPLKKAAEIAVAVLLLSIFQLFFAFFVSVITITDSVAVYKASYL